ncbi:MAG TPA: hypothetical protein VGD56_10875 [Gemmatirosa sp.]
MLVDRSCRTRVRLARAARPRRVLAAAALACGEVFGRRGAAQLPALPSAQSAFPAPGLALALDGGHADGRTVPAIAGATGVRRLQLTAAVGLPGGVNGYDRSGVSAGGRLAARLFRTTRLGVSAFAGYGFERMRGPASYGIEPIGFGPPPPSAERPIGRLTQVPAGISAGVRGVLGDRPYAVSVAPMYTYMRWNISDTTRTRGGARLAALGEIAVTSQIGFGVAAEFGSGGPAGSPYAASRAVFGAGLSYAIRRVVAR